MTIEAFLSLQEDMIIFNTKLRACGIVGYNPSNNESERTRLISDTLKGLNPSIPELQLKSYFTFGDLRVTRVFSAFRLHPSFRDDWEIALSIAEIPDKDVVIRLLCFEIERLKKHLQEQPPISLSINNQTISLPTIPFLPSGINLLK